MTLPPHPACRGCIQDRWWCVGNDLENVPPYPNVLAGGCREKGRQPIRLVWRTIWTF
ncbi:MAG: hypothetical protein N3E46_04555 [Gemmataceae bacterium]|nr:hypothetical protein [Gemmataceae bacterium]